MQRLQQKGIADHPPECRASFKLLVCATSLMASLIRSVSGLLKYFYQALWLVDLNAEVIDQSINRRGVAQEFPHHVNVSSSFSARFLYGFPYSFQRAWTVLCSTKHPLDIVRVGAWNSLYANSPLIFSFVVQPQPLNECIYTQESRKECTDDYNDPWMKLICIWNLQYL